MHQMQTAQYITWKYPNRFITSGSLGVMGFGLPSSIGVQLAKPAALVIDIDGDSSFMMTMSDLKTIKEHNLPIKIMIMNIHNLFYRLEPNDKEVRILASIISALYKNNSKP